MFHRLLASVISSLLVATLFFGAPQTAKATDLVGLAAGDSISAGGSSGCALVSGAAYCWGDNWAGQVGNDLNLMGATAVAGGHAFSAISVGRTSTCALDLAGAAWCWGWNAYGQLGDGTFDSSSTPVAVSGGHTFTSISVGGYGACAIDGSFAAWCWGMDSDGELGSGSYGGASAGVPQVVTGGHLFTSISYGTYTVCGLIQTTKRAFCWGYGGYGSRGDGGGIFSGTPTEVIGAHEFASISVGGQATCALTDAGAAWCWGWNESGELGDGTTTQRNEPVSAASSMAFKQISVGKYAGIDMKQTCAISLADAAWCWGANSFNSSSNLGLLGDGTLTNAFTPQAVIGSHSFASISAGYGFNCAKDLAGQAWCWGGNDCNSILGDGTGADSGVDGPKAVILGVVGVCGGGGGASCESLSPTVCPTINDAGSARVTGAPGYWYLTTKTTYTWVRCRDAGPAVESRTMLARCREIKKVAGYSASMGRKPYRISRTDQKWGYLRLSVREGEKTYYSDAYDLSND